MSQAASDEPASTDVAMDEPESSTNEQPVHPTILHENGNIAVFWDMNDYPVTCEDPVTIYSSIKQTLEDAGFRGENLSIKAYVDDDKLSPELLEKYNDAGIVTETFGTRGKAAKTRLVKMDVLFWALTNPLAGNLFLLSKDAELIPHFEDFYLRNYGGFVSDAQPTEANPDLYIPCECKGWLLSAIPEECKRQRKENEQLHQENERLHQENERLRCEYKEFVEDEEE